MGLFFNRRPRRDDPWTEALWVYDHRTNKRFTLKERPLRQSDLVEFVTLARLRDRHIRAIAYRPGVVTRSTCGWRASSGQYGPAPMPTSKAGQFHKRQL